MASGKLSKTARASLGGKDKNIGGMVRECPQCETPMVATKVIKSARMPGGMYWVCPKDDVRVKT